MVLIGVIITAMAMALIAMTIIIVGLFQGIDGVWAASGIGTMSGLAGYQIDKKRKRPG